MELEIPSHLVFPVILWSNELFLLEGDGELAGQKERSKLLLVSDSVTKISELKLDSSRSQGRVRVGAQELVTVSDKHGKDSGLEISLRQCFVFFFTLSVTELWNSLSWTHPQIKGSVKIQGHGTDIF